MDLCNCAVMTDQFHLYSTSLLLYLDGLNFCNCRQLSHECSRRPSAITTFHNRIYDKICETEKFNEVCRSAIYQKDSDTTRQCDQILQYQRGVLYKDWYIASSPFCYVYGYGGSKDVYDQDPSIFSRYNNMSSSCQAAVIISFIVLYLLCVAIIIANITVLLVFRFDEYFHTAYGYFKASIALADLLVGVVVIPLVIYHLHTQTFSPMEFREPGKFVTTNDFGGYITTVGFFTVLSLAVSIYCLAAASLDRYFSISRPFRYQAKKFFTKTKALVLIFFVWLLSSVLALFPVMTSRIIYGAVSATFVLAAILPARNNTSPTIFPWMNLFNTRRSLNNTSTLDMVQSRSFFQNHTVTQPHMMETENEVAKDKLQSKVLLQSEGLYLLLCMYLFCLILPLIFLWVVNVGTVRAYVKKNKTKKSRLSTGDQSGSSTRSTGINFQIITASPSISNASSLCSLNNVAHRSTSLYKNNGNEPQNLENQDRQLCRESKYETFLSVPTSGKKEGSWPRRGFRDRANSTPVRPRLGSDAVEQKMLFQKHTRCSSARSSISVQSTNSTTRQNTPHNKCKVATRMQRGLVRMSIAFTLSVMPAICALIVYVLFYRRTNSYSMEIYSGYLKLIQNSLSFISSVFLYGNSFMNCIIYTVLGKRFREDAKNLYAGKVKELRKCFRRFSILLGSNKKKENVETINPPKIVEDTV